MRYVILLFVVLGLSSSLTAQDLTTENVIIITMDGLRWQELFGGAVDSLIDNRELTSDQDRMRDQFLAPSKAARREKLMPFFWGELAKQGMVFGNRWEGNKVDCSNIFWFSYPGYNEILTGYSDPRIRSNAKVWNPNETVLEWLHKKPAFAGKVAAFGSWDVFDWIVNEQRSGIPVNSGFNQAEGDTLTPNEQYLNKLQEQSARLWGSVRQDVFTHNYLLESLKKDHPRVAYISYGETDDFAHDGSYNRYLDAAHATDAMWQELWTFLQSDPFYAGKTSLVITTDHGRGSSPMTEWKSHGKTYEGSNAIWIAVIGPDTPNLGMIKKEQHLFQRQVAKTAAALLGYDYVNTYEEVGPVLPGVISTKR